MSHLYLKNAKIINSDILCGDCPVCGYHDFGFEFGEYMLARPFQCGWAGSFIIACPGCGTNFAGGKYGNEGLNIKSLYTCMTKERLRPRMLEMKKAKKELLKIFKFEPNSLLAIKLLKQNVENPSPEQIKGMLEYAKDYLLSYTKDNLRLEVDIDLGHPLHVFDLNNLEAEPKIIHTDGRCDYFDKYATGMEGLNLFPKRLEIIKQYISKL